jgi:hypothetical protein
MADLTQTQVAAALVESIYRRSPNDQPIDPIQNIGGADVDAADIDIDGKRMAITPGMAVSAEIITGDRRVIEYVLSPILRYRHESARER